MIKITSPEQIAEYFNIPGEAIDFLLNLTENTENKKYYFGDDCLINVQTCLTKTECKLMEAHDKNVDIQYLIRGEEKIYYTNIEGLTVTKPRPENSDNTLFAFDERADFVCITSGEGVILYPGEAHTPNKAPGEPMEIKKAVIKINKALAK